jgi:hypothetical protein
MEYHTRVRLFYRRMVGQHLGIQRTANAYVTGLTVSPNFPVTAARSKRRSEVGERDGYIAKIAAEPVAASAGGKVTGGGSVEMDGGLARSHSACNERRRADRLTASYSSSVTRRGWRSVACR